MPYACNYTVELPQGEGFDMSDKKAIESLGLKIRSERNAAGLTQAQLAEKIGVSLDTVVRIERGSDAVAIGTILKIGQALDIPAAMLLSKDEPIATDRASGGDVEAFRRKLHSLAKSRGKSPAMIAKEVEVEYQTVRGYFAGTRVPSSKVQVKLAQMFGVNVMDLWIDPDTPLKHESSIDEKIAQVQQEIRKEFDQLKGFIEAMVRKNK